ncbi:MAG: hypothetical protein ACM3SQ_15910 [Betaproteobacteria bacterium]
MKTPPAISTGPAGLDILEYVSVSVPCGQCGRHYDVTLRQVLLSQDMLHEGCPATSPDECMPLTYAGLANETTLHDFDRSWACVLRQVQAAGFHLAFGPPPLAH